MLGPEGAAERVTAWLTTRLPARLRILEARYGTDEEPVTLPDPALVVDHDTGPLGLEDWPAVIVTPLRLVALEYVDTTTAGEVYRTTYAIDVLEWVRADDYATTDQLRRRYALATREALLERKSLEATPAYGTPGAGTFAIDPGSLGEDYGPVVVDEAQRTIAGVRLSVNVTVAEVLEAAAPMGTADTLTVTETPATGPLANTVIHPGLS